jgi:hypothetical protein
MVTTSILLTGRADSDDPVKDLAARFADGRLSTEKLIAADDEQLAEMLIAVRGIGKASSTLLTFEASVHHSHFPVDW